MIPGLSEAGLDDRELVPQALFRSAQRQSERGQIRAAAIAQLDALEVVPDALVGVEFGSIARQPLQVQAIGRAFAQEVLDWLPAMDGRAIPDDQQFAPHLAQQQPQEADDIGRAVGMVLGLLGLHEEPTIRRNAADGRQMVVG